MASAQKFLFETSFDPPATAPELAEPPPPTYSEAELAEARAEGVATGRAEANAEYERARAEYERLGALRLAETLDAIGTALAAMKLELDERLAAHARAAIEIATALASKIGGAAARLDGASPVAAMISECLPRLLDEPRIVVRVADAALDHVRGHVLKAADRAGYQGKVVLLGDPRLAEPACRVEWADGGADYDPARVAAEADAVVARFLAGASGAVSDSPEQGAL